MDLQYILFEFEGRINRGSFWLGTVIVWGVLLVAGLIFARNSSLLFIYGIVVFLSLWPAVAISIKRWHDRNKSGWWLFIALVPVIGTIWALVETGFLPGTPGRNRYGPDPLTDPDAY